jgi:hypothetical protein
MKKKNALKKAAVKLDLEKIEIDVLSDSMLNGLQGGYYTEPNPYTVCATQATKSDCSLECTHTPTFCQISC